MIDVETESLIPIKDSAPFFPGRRPHLAAIYRWKNKPTGALEICKVGGRVFTSREAILRFVRACNSKGTIAPPASRQKHHEAVDAELSRIGI